MPSVITGNKDNVTTPLIAMIAGATNATPIVIATSAPHDFQTGDRITIALVLGNLAANSDIDSPWEITVQDSVHFALNDSVGNGSYVSGGIAIDLSLSPPFNNPSDGDDYDAESVDVALQGLSDRSQWLAWRLSQTWLRSQTIPALNWFPVIAQTLNLIAAAWDKRGQWWGCSVGTGDQVGTSTDNGQTWASVTPGSDTRSLQTIAIDESGNVVTFGPLEITPTHCVVYQLTGSTDVWADETVYSDTGSNASLGEIVWEKTAGVWLLFTWDNGTLKQTRLHSSVDRVTWTSQTAHLPAGVLGSGTSTQPRIAIGNGRIVVGVFYAGSAHISSAAASALTVWSTAATLTPIITCTAMTDPVYIASSDTWLVGLQRTASTTGIEIWASTDGGETWAWRVTLGGTTHSNPTLQFAALDSVVVGLTSSGQIQYSLDSGFTWYPGPSVGTIGASARSIWPGDGGFLELDTGGGSDGSAASIQCGAPRRLAITT
jgi:hypothetical protein